MSKKVIICGTGEVGSYAAEVLGAQRNEITVIDLHANRFEQLDNFGDIAAIKGSSCHPDILDQAGVDKTSLLIAATNSDEVNILSAALAKRMGCKSVIARVHNRSFFAQEDFDFLKGFNIDRLICPEKITAIAIASRLADPGVAEIQHLADNKLELHRYEIKKSTPVCNQSLREIGMPFNVRVALIERGPELIGASGDAKLLEGDMVTLIGMPEPFAKIQSLFDEPYTQNRKITIMSATPLTEWLIGELQKGKFSIKLFETNRETAIRFSEKFPDITIINSDPTVDNEFDAENLEESYAFIAMGNEDERNILGALQAKKKGVALCSAIINTATYIPLLEGLGIDLPYSPRIVAAKAILDTIDDTKVKAISKIGSNKINIYQIKNVTHGSSVGKPLHEIDFWDGAFIVGIDRADKGFYMPDAKDVVFNGDTLYIIAPSGKESQLTKMFLK